MNHIFGKLKMEWLSVVLFAVAAGIYTGIVMAIDPLKDTSFQDIGITFEWWVVFAVVIVVKCKKNWEAMLKCFVFFLISQPLVYAVEVLCGHLTLDMAMYYYKTIWLPRTILTLPGGLIAFYCKKENMLGAVILGLGNTIQGTMGAYFVAQMFNTFPRHLLSAIFCFVSIVVMSLAIQKKAKYRIVAFAIPLVLIACLFIFLHLTGRVLF